MQADHLDDCSIIFTLLEEGVGLEDALQSYKMEIVEHVY